MTLTPRLGRVQRGGGVHANPDQLSELCQRYALEIDPTSVPDVIKRFGVDFPAAPLG